MKKKLFILLLLGIFSTTISTSLVNAAEISLSTADSLFQSKKYTESYEIYKKILQQEKKATPAMLLKMAFIKEGIKDFPMALFYLNKYYRVTNDRQALVHMNEIAQANELKGYELNDQSYFKNLYRIYEKQIIIISFSLLIGFLIILFIAKKQKKKQPNAIIGAVVMLTVGLTFMLLINPNPKMGIISYAKTPLMEAPASGSKVNNFLTIGDRFQLDDKNDVWWKIDSESNNGFVREQNILIIE